MDGYGGYHFPNEFIARGGLMEAKSLQGDQISAYHLTAAAARGDENQMMGDLNQEMSMIQTMCIWICLMKGLHLTNHGFFEDVFCWMFHPYRWFSHHLRGGFDPCLTTISYVLLFLVATKNDQLDTCRIYVWVSRVVLFCLVFWPPKPEQPFLLLMLQKSWEVLKKIALFYTWVSLGFQKKTIDRGPITTPCVTIGSGPTLSFSSSDCHASSSDFRWSFFESLTFAKKYGSGKKNDTSPWFLGSEKRNSTTSLTMSLCLKIFR